ncbi:MAG: hypothetical protein WCB63_18770 [Polyangiales bacterium]
MTARSLRCLCMFCGARKKRIVDACAECSRRPQSDIELAKSVLVSSPVVEVEGRWLGLEDENLERVTLLLADDRMAWSEADVKAVLPVVRGLQQRSSWWRDWLVYVGFAGSMLLLCWISWLFIRKLVSFLD